MKGGNKITIPKEKIKKDTCNILIVPKEICYIKFKRTEKPSYCISDVKRGNKITNFNTNRDEMLILDFNNKDEIIGIELLDSKEAKKPCMGRDRK